MALTAARGRGKSAALGVAIAGAIALGLVSHTLVLFFQFDAVYYHQCQSEANTHWQEIVNLITIQVNSIVVLL